MMGNNVERMSNGTIIVYNARNTSSVVEAMLKLKLTNSYFLSRDDDSGTHKKELFFLSFLFYDVFLSF